MWVCTCSDSIGADGFLLSVDVWFRLFGCVRTRGLGENKAMMYCRRDEGVHDLWTCVFRGFGGLGGINIRILFYYFSTSF